MTLIFCHKTQVAISPLDRDVIYGRLRGRTTLKHIYFLGNTLSRRRPWSLWSVAVHVARESNSASPSWNVATVPQSATSSANTTCPCRASPTLREPLMPNWMAVTWRILLRSSRPWSLLFLTIAWRRLNTEVFQRLDFTESRATRQKLRTCWKNSWLDEDHPHGTDISLTESQLNVNGGFW